MKKVKLGIYVSEEQADQLRSYAKRLDMTLTGVGTLAIKLGLATMHLATDPKMKEFFEKQIEEDIDAALDKTS